MHYRKQSGYSLLTFFTGPFPTVEYYANAKANEKKNEFIRKVKIKFYAMQIMSKHK